MWLDQAEEHDLGDGLNIRPYHYQGRNHPAEYSNIHRTDVRKELQFVWPKDKPHQSKLSRLCDVMTGKGPDMYVQKKGDAGPHRSVWSGWYAQGLPYNLGEYTGWTGAHPNEQTNYLNPSFMGTTGLERERRNQVYDFRERKYGRVKPGIWSDARYTREGPARGLKAYHREWNGIEEAFELHDLIRRERLGQSASSWTGGPLRFREYGSDGLPVDINTRSGW